jgi:hypothetical protein
MSLKREGGTEQGGDHDDCRETIEKVHSYAILGPPRGPVLR